MKIISKTEFWKNLWDHLPEWSEDQSGGGGAGEPEDQVGEEAQAQAGAPQDQNAQEDQDGQPDPEEDSQEPDGGKDGDEEESGLPNGQDGDGDQNEDGDYPGHAWEITEGEPKGPTIPGYRLEIDANGTENYVREFASWWDFVTCASDDRLYAWQKTGTRRSHTKQTNTSDFDRGTPDFQTACDMALRTGWPEGRKMLDDQLTTAIRHQHLVDNWSFDVAGAFPMIPLFCAGDPACMVIDPQADLKTQTPIVRIDYNFATAWTTPTQAIMTKGAAVVSLANNLERQGIQTELRIIANVRSRNGRQIFRLSIVYKRAGERLDLDRTAFAIAHPAVLRRLTPAIVEQHKDLEDQFRYGYGLPMHQPNDPTSGQPGGALFIPGAQATETPESAKAAVEKAAQALQPSNDPQRRRAA